MEKKAKSPRTENCHSKYQLVDKNGSAGAKAQGRCGTRAGQQRGGSSFHAGDMQKSHRHAVRVLAPGAGLGLCHLHIPLPIVIIAHRAGANK